ncbi:MAG: hypothetical protein J6P94_02155, partial [Oscillospiraceae bacterium]|nr:hypothetical protein [Oscillospiraceae bacterium]
IEFIQFTELWTGGIAYITEEELPETFYAMDNINSLARLHTPEFDSGFVNFYFSIRGEFVQQNPATGDKYFFELSELTDERIIISDHHVEYINGEERIRLPASAFEASHFYDSIMGLYGYETQVLQGWSAITNNVLYARDVEGAKAMVIDANGHDFSPERGRRYTLHGQFVTSNAAHLRFAITDFYEGCETEPWQDTRDSSAAPIFYEYADYYSRANNHATVEASADIASLEAFQQDIFRLEEGRFPAAGEKGVCLVSGDIARQMELRVGDKINISYFASSPDDRFDVSENGRIAALEVVGISTMPENYWGYVWVSDAEGNFGSEHYGYRIGRALLDNASAREAAEAIQALCPEGVRVTLFDQGYSSAAQPLETMRSTALAVTLASACGALAVIFLFAYLFVGRQKETVNVLFSLGTPRGRISLWLLSGAVMISAAASAVGAWLGGLALGKIISFAFSAAQALYAVDSRYSESAVGLVREALPIGKTPIWPALAAFAFIFVLSLLL